MESGYSNNARLAEFGAVLDPESSERLKKILDVNVGHIANVSMNITYHIKVCFVISYY